MCIIDRNIIGSYIKQPPAETRTNENEEPQTPAFSRGIGVQGGGLVSKVTTGQI